MNDIINKVFLQNCGDSLKILRRSEKRVIRGDKKLGEYYYECEFVKYPYKVFVTSGEIKRGTVLNPRIEEEEFIKKEWLQHCGDSLKIIAVYKKDNRGVNIWKAEFINHPYQIFAYKENIIKGKVNNPQIEIDEYTNKIIKQNCGDSVILIKKIGNLWEGHFINYFNIVKKPLSYFIAGEVLNNQLPWRCKSSLAKYIKERFPNKKPTLFELSISLNKSLALICNKINEFELNNLISYSYQEEENQIKKYIKSLYKGKIERYCGTKEENYLEIDIYFPELKKGIEYNGSIWHEEGNPNNKFSKPIGYHKQKQEFFAKKGIEILFIWDYEWFEDFPKRQVINEQIKQKIREFLGI